MKAKNFTQFREDISSISETADFCVVRIMTTKGERIAICYTTSASEYGTVINSGLLFQDACDIAERWADENNIMLFNRSTEKWIGQVPEYMLTDKKKKGSYLAENKDKINKKKNDIFNKIDTIQDKINKLSKEYSMKNNHVVESLKKDIESLADMI